MNTQTLPKNLTSYDLLKTFAVITMIIDHIGVYFFPDEVWFRVIGRLSAPVWFFLIGYASSRQVPKLWILGALALTGSMLVAGEYLFPLNILFLLASVRLILDGVMVRALRNREAMIGMFLLLALLAIPSMIFVDYGSTGILLAMIGYMCRNREALKIKLSTFLIFTVSSVSLHTLIQSALLDTLDLTQFIVLSVGMMGVVIMLMRFKPHTFKASGVWTSPFQFMGRRTLEIYVLHLLIFKAAAMVLNPEAFSLFNFSLFVDEKMLQLFL